MKSIRKSWPLLFLSLCSLSLSAHDNAPAEEEPKEEKEDPDEANAPNAETGPDRGKDRVTNPYYQFHPLIIPIVKKDKVLAHLRLVIQFKAEKPEKYEEYRKAAPILRDKFFTDLYGAFASLWVESQEPNIESIRTRLKAVADKVLGEGKVQILIKSYYFHYTADGNTPE